jgi:hypothetical protein
MSVSALTQLNLFYGKCMGQLPVNTQQQLQHGLAFPLALQNQPVKLSV